jgi:hypothetical protein
MLSRMERWFTVVIPTRDSAAWIGILIRHYQKHGITPTILLDIRSTDATREIVEGLGAPVVDISGFTYTEAIVRVTKDCVRTPWALFIHDDEFCSAALFARLAGPPPPPAAQSVAISRRWAWYEPGKPLLYGSSPLWQDRTERHGQDHGWRLFRPDQVVHFEWVLRSHTQRIAKLRRYDEARYGFGKFFAKTYLPESQPPGVITYTPFETAEFNELAAAYFAARRPAQKLPRRSLRTHFYRARHFLAQKLHLEQKNFSKADPGRERLQVKLDREMADPYNM